MSDEEKSDFSKNYFDKITMGFQVFVIFPDALAEREAISVADVGRKLDPSKSFLVVGETQHSKFSSIVHFALHLARKFRLLKNERTSILLNEEDRFQKLNLILCSKNKEMYGSFESDISDVLDLARITAQSSDKDESESSQSYRKFMQSSNLVDSHGLYQILKTALSESESPLKMYLQSMTCNLLIYNPYFGPKSWEMNFLRLFCLEEQPLLVQFETPLDASLHEESHPEFQIRLSPLFDLPESDLVANFRRQVRSESVDYCLAWMEGILRLLVNSRDELALARIMCGPCGILDPTAFTLIKHQAQSVNMPLYQTLISYVGKLKLGGKSYAPSTNHPLYPYNKELCGFESLMDKLHSKVEEVKNEPDLAAKIIQTLRSFAVKTEKLKTARVESAAEICLEVLNASWELDENIQLGSTPKREVGKGGSVVGRQNMKIVRAGVDLLSARSRPINLHVLLGKIPVEHGKKADAQDQGTPVQVLTLAKLYTSPEEVPETTAKSHIDIKDTSNASTPTRRPSAKGRPKYGSTLAWAPETSPILMESPEIFATTTVQNEKRKLAEVDILIQDVESCLEGGKLAKARADGEKAFKRMRRDKKSVVHKVAKRSILKDIANMKTPVVLEKSEEIIKPKLTALTDHDHSQSNANATKENPLNRPVSSKNKAVRKKAAPPTLLRGQTKLTAYFRI